MTDHLPTHSKLGASSAERWMECPGSVTLLKLLHIEEVSDEPDYQKHGTAAHHWAAKCLTEDMEGWEIIGEEYENGVTADPVIATSVQFWLDRARPVLLEAKAKGGEWRIEERIYRPDLHALYYGTADFTAYIPETETLHVFDFKDGVGIAVDVEWNRQLLYYAYGLLDRYPGARTVKIYIVQPRGFHPDGPFRPWEISTEDLCTWAEEELLPAMRGVEMDHKLEPGEWCRFCPAKLVCPVLTSLFGAASKADPKEIINLSNESLGRSYQYVQAVKFYLKALEAEIYRLNNLGKTVPGTKLVAGKANRVFKEGAEAILRARYGTDAYSDPVLKSPAQIEALGGDGTLDVVKEWAYTPLAGLVVAREEDKRPAVKITSLQDKFAGAKIMEE